MSVTPTHTQVTHDVGTHCALAEAVTRIRHMEDKLVKTRHDELITQVRARCGACVGMAGTRVAVRDWKFGGLGEHTQLP